MKVLAFSNYCQGIFYRLHGFGPFNAAKGDAESRICWEKRRKRCSQPSLSLTSGSREYVK